MTFSPLQISFANQAKTLAQFGSNQEIFQINFNKMLSSIYNTFYDL